MNTEEELKIEHAATHPVANPNPLGPPVAPSVPAHGAAVKVTVANAKPQVNNSVIPNTSTMSNVFKSAAAVQEQIREKRAAIAGLKKARPVAPKTIQRKK